MGNEYLRAFIIGSSFIIFAPFFYAVSQFDPKKLNYSYISYTFLAPVVLGMMNVISLFLANKYKFDSKKRYLLISLLAPTFVLVTVYWLKTYNFTQSEWIEYIWKLYLLYFITFNILMYNLDKLI